MDQSKLEKVLRVYNPDCRYLQEAKLDFPRGEGKFRIPKPYYVEGTGHFNAVEMMICYNQLAYGMLSEFGGRGLIKELGKIPFEQFLGWQLENCFIVGMDEVKFKRAIDTSKQIQGNIELKRVRKVGDLYVFNTSYDFENGRAKGNIDLALFTGVMEK